MANLRPIELKLIDDLTGMASGSVLDFSNRTFEEFFREEVGVDIYDDAYADVGTSKGKRLRSFLIKAQPRAVAIALTALWEYREVGRIDRGEDETVPRARARLSAIVERLGGSPLPDHSDTTEPVQPEPEQTRKSPGTTELQGLQDRFFQIHSMEPHPRGYALEGFLTDLFNTWELDARGGFRLEGEQIDGSFVLDGDVFLLEAKWQQKPVDAATLHSFQGKVNERADWARGLFVSYSGFSNEALRAFTAKRIILMDGMDIADTIQRGLALHDVLRAKLRYAVERRDPFGRTSELLTG